MTYQDGWSYGMRHQMEPYEDVETILEYSVYWPDPSAKGGEGESDADAGHYELIDAREVLHLKGPDTDGAIKRGCPCRGGAGPRCSSFRPHRMRSRAARPRRR